MFVALIGFFCTAGIFAGLSLLPKLLLIRRKVNSVIVTVVTSIIIAVSFISVIGDSRNCMRVRIEGIFVTLE